MTTYSDTYPTIQRLRGKILYPYNVTEQAVTDEDGSERTEYAYDLLQLQDRGQQVADTEKFKTDNWAELRQAAYGSWQEQMDMQHHGTWDDHVDRVKAEFPKP